MHTDNGGVDHLDSGIVGSGKCVYDAAPDTSPPPADETVIAGRVRAKMIRQIAPRCPGSQDPEDAVEDTSVVYQRNATRLVWQHRSYGGPFIVGEFVAHVDPPVWEIESRGVGPSATLLARPRFGAHRVEADINLPTTPVESVENDPTQTWAVKFLLRCTARLVCRA